MSELSVYNDEIIELLRLQFPDFNRIQLDNFQQILGGADTTIYGFDFASETETIPLILRIYRPAYSDSARREFTVMRNLYTEGISVPRPYICNENSSATGKSYIVMERIEGDILSNVLNSTYSTPRFDVLLESFVENLVKINSIDWTTQFRFLDSYDIVENSHLFIKHQISHPKQLVQEYALDTLSPVISWLEENQPELQEPCFLHSDYHAMNVLVRNDDSLVTIDWSNAKLGDFRYDLGFTILALRSMVHDLQDKIVKIYENKAEVKVGDIDYFIVLSSLWNLFRIYSGAFDYRITGENPETIRLLATEYYDYASAIIKTTQETTGVPLDTLLDELNKRKEE
ncbi:MAG: phosphotransferase family protein [Candidatus Thorarchaeota archaeon]